MALTREHILARLKAMQPDIAERYGVEIFGLVGSWARGEAGPDSDIDVVYHLDETRRVSLLDLGGVWSDLNDSLNRHIDLIDWKMLKDRQKKLMQKDLIRFYG